MQKIVAEITGTVWKVLVRVGDRVAADDTTVVMESMKMEIPVMADDAGIIQEVLIKEGDVVQEGQVLITLRPDQ